MQAFDLDDDTAGRWYALQVKQRYEKITAAVLRNKGYREFLPTYRTRRRWSDRLAEVEFPLFPGYVFCHFDINDRHAPIVTTPGVVRIVGVGRIPAPVADDEIGAIHQVIESGLAAEPCRFLQAGARVRVEYGALAGVEGIFLEAKKHQRLVISVTLLQRSIAVEIDAAWVAPVGCGHPTAVATAFD